MTEGVRNGIVLVFNPASCSAHAGIFPDLALVDSIPGVTVVGMMTLTPSADELAQIRRDYGIAFELRTISRQQLSGILREATIHIPLAVIIRKGRVEAILGATPLERIGPDLPYLFTDRP